MPFLGTIGNENAAVSMRRMPTDSGAWFAAIDPGVLERNHQVSQVIELQRVGLAGCLGRFPQLARQFGCLLRTQRRQRINSARPQRRHAERGGGDAEHHADGAEGDGEIER
jgi:hypothetical protein